MIKEILWFIGVVLLSFLGIFVVFNLESLSPGSVTDINIHDTYFVIPTPYFVVLIIILIFFAVYLVRMIKSKFKNKTANLIFIVSTILLVLKLTQMIFILNTFVQVGDNSANTGTSLMAFSNILFLAQVVLMILLTYSGIKIGSSYKHSNQ